MPKKPRTRRFDGPLKNIQKPNVSDSQAQSEVQTSSGDNQESAEAKFERELTWCIEQLELGLENQNPDSRQAMEAVKVLKILTSHKAPMIKKRQVMRNTFGDYRQKIMSEERKSAAKVRKLAFASGGESSRDKKSLFFRKSKASQSGGTLSETDITTSTSTCKTSDTEQSVSSTSDKVHSSQSSGHNLPKAEKVCFNFFPSDTEFKFDFNLSLSDSNPNDKSELTDKDSNPNDKSELTDNEDTSTTDVKKDTETDKCESESVKTNLKVATVDQQLTDYFKNPRKDNSFLFNFSDHQKEN